MGLVSSIRVCPAAHPDRCVTHEEGAFPRASA